MTPAFSPDAPPQSSKQTTLRMFVLLLALVIIYLTDHAIEPILGS